MNMYKQRLEAVAKGIAKRSPSARRLELSGVASWQEGLVVQKWTAGPDFTNYDGTIFGGYIAAIVDEVAAFATMSVLEDEYIFKTSDLQITYFRTIKPGEIKVEGRVVHRGQGTANIEVDFWRPDGKLAARGRVTQAIRPLTEEEKNALARLGMAAS